MNKLPLPSAITKNEFRAGLALMVLHIIVLPLGLSAVDAAFSFGMDTTTLNVVYYALSFALSLVLLGRFLKREFYALTENLSGTIFGVLIGYLLLTALSNLVYYLLLAVLNGESINPNDEAVIDAVQTSSGAMIAVAVLLGPVVEETIFRGVLFGSLRSKSRVAAYLVSWLIFSVYHLWQYAVADPDPRLLIMLLDYLPASLALGWAYERSRNLWCPIVVHALINLISVSYYINL